MAKNNSQSFLSKTVSHSLFLLKLHQQQAFSFFFLRLVVGESSVLGQRPMFFQKRPMFFPKHWEKIFQTPYIFFSPKQPQNGGHFNLVPTKLLNTIAQKHFKARFLISTTKLLKNEYSQSFLRIFAASRSCIT